MIKITADSTCDLNKEILQDLKISLIPLHILVEEEDFLDGVHIKPKDIFEYVGAQGKSCSTAAINSFEYEQFFKPLAEQYEAVIHINLSHHLSSCYQNAKIAAQNFDNVYIIDSLNLSTGSGHLVYEAALLAQQKLTAQEIVARIESLKANIRASFVIDKMDYLKKGGRCTSLEAFGATLLKIKPSIEVVDGKMSVGKKYRGNFKSVLEKYVNDQLASIEKINPSCIFITHSHCSPSTVQKVRQQIESYNHFDQIIETTAGCTISTHCGPNTLGILFKTK
ncbi:MAG: DegV family protein [Lysinibacillus sp.]